MSIDLAAFRNGRPQATQALALPADGGLEVTGLPLLAQRVVLHFLSKRDELLGVGCGFVERLTTGNVASETDVFLAYYASAGEVANLARAEESDGDDPDEVLAGLRLDALVVEEGALRLNITVTAGSGRRLGVELPLQFILVG